MNIEYSAMARSYLESQGDEYSDYIGDAADDSTNIEQISSDLDMMVSQEVGSLERDILETIYTRAYDAFVLDATGQYTVDDATVALTYYYRSIYGADIPSTEIDEYVNEIIQSWQDAKRDVSALAHETKLEMGVEPQDMPDESAVDEIDAADNETHRLSEQVVQHDQHPETQERGLSDDPLFYLSESAVVERLMGELVRGNSTFAVDLRAGVDRYADILGPISLETMGGDRSWSVLMAPNMVGAIRDSQMQPEDVSVVPHTMRDDMSTSMLGMIQRGTAISKVEDMVGSPSQIVETEDGMQMARLPSPAEQNYSWKRHGHMARMKYGYTFDTLPMNTQEDFAPLEGWVLPGYDILYDNVYDSGVVALEGYSSDDIIESQLVIELRPSSFFDDNTPSHRFAIQKKQNDTYEIYPMIGKFLRAKHPDQTVHADELMQTLYAYLSPMPETADRSFVDDETPEGSILSGLRGWISADEPIETYAPIMRRVDDVFATAPSGFRIAQRSGEDLTTEFFGGEELDLRPYGLDSACEIDEDGDLLRLSFGPDMLLESSQTIGDGENNWMWVDAMLLATTMHNMNMIEIRKVSEETYSLYGQEMSKEQIQEFINTVAIPIIFYVYARRYASYAVAHLPDDVDNAIRSDDGDNIEQSYVGFMIDALHGDTTMLDVSTRG